jgi:anti-sigma B factor antagonist
MCTDPADIAAPSQPVDDMSTAVTTIDDTAVLAVAGNVDLLTAPALREAVRHVLDTRPAALIIDLTHVQFLASAGMQVLVATSHATGNDTPFAVVADGRATARPIRLTALDTMLSVYSTRTEAVLACKARLAARP